ncbi:MAG: protein-L-isoaspartate O-methyltransferase [Pseudomonadota bacterium]
MAELIADPFRAARLILSLRQSGITHPGVLKAMESIDRASFAPGDLSDLAFEDVHLPLPAGQTIAPPLVTAQILAAADFGDRPHGRALLIGAGSGFSSALLSGLVEEVVAAERSAKLAHMASAGLSDLGVLNVRVLHADGLSGCLAHGPYSHILAMGGLAKIPEPLFKSLASGGVIVAPVGTFESLELQVWRQDECVSRAPLLTSLLPLRDGLSKAL